VPVSLFSPSQNSPHHPPSFPLLRVHKSEVIGSGKRWRKKGWLFLDSSFFFPLVNSFSFFPPLLLVYNYIYINHTKLLSVRENYFFSPFSHEGYISLPSLLPLSRPPGAKNLSEREETFCCCGCPFPFLLSFFSLKVWWS